MKALSLFCMFCGLASALNAQEPSQPTPRPTPPPGPLLDKAPEMAQWTVTSKTSIARPIADPEGKGQPTPSPSASASGGQKATASPTDQTTTVVKTKSLRFEQTMLSGGAKIQKWFVPDMQITLRGASAPVVTLSGVTRNNYYVDYSKSDFLGFEWISPQNFTGITKVSGQDCLVFKDKVKVDPESSTAPRAAAVACIALDSRLPVALQLDQEVRTYQFGAPPTDMLELPQDVALVVEKWRKTLRQAALPPGRP